MPDTKITALAAIVTVDPAVDVLPIVDVSDTSMAASGTTKKITSNQLLGSGGTATLASATITGDLTVHTSTLKVDSTNNRVGVNTASPAYAFDNRGVLASGNPAGTIVGGITYSTRPEIGSLSNNDVGFIANSVTQYLIAVGGTHTWYNSGSTAMTLNSTGLAVGTPPANDKILSLGSMGILLSGATSDFSFRNSVGTAIQRLRYTDSTGTLTIGSATGTSYPVELGGSTTARAVTIDASGNLLVGTTSQNGSWNTKFTLSNDSGTTRWAVGPYLGGVTNFLISAGAAAGVYLNGTAATSWTSASDERLKDIIEPISNAVAKVGSLRAVIGKFKFDELNTRKPFLIAQDVQAVLPEAVDASNPDKLGVAYTDVIPLLVAAIQELNARVQTLETR